MACCLSELFLTLNCMNKTEQLMTREPLLKIPMEQPTNVVILMVFTDSQNSRVLVCLPPYTWSEKDPERSLKSVCAREEDVLESFLMSSASAVQAVKAWRKRRT